LINLAEISFAFPAKEGMRFPQAEQRTQHGLRIGPAIFFACFGARHPDPQGTYHAITQVVEAQPFHESFRVILSSDAEQKEGSAK
jgi:hypothetical protein